MGLQSVPDRVVGEERGFSMRCAVPDALAGELQGHQEEATRKIELSTGAKIQVAQQPEREFRAVSVTGPLFGSVAAYIRLMTRYLEVESQGRASCRSGGAVAGAQMAQQDLQQGMEQLEQLHREMI